MATPQELQKIQKLLKDIEQAYDRLGQPGNNPFRNFDTSSIQNVQDEIKRLQDGLDGVRSRINATKTTFKDLHANLKEIVREINPKGVNYAKDFENGFKGVVREAEKLRYEEEGISKLSLKELETIAKRVEKRKSDAKAAAEALLTQKGIDVSIDRRTRAYRNLSEEEKAAVNYLRDTVKLEDTLQDKINQRIKQEERILELMGLGGAAVAGVQTALDKMGFGALGRALGLDEVEKKMREVAEEIEASDDNIVNFSNKFKVLKAGISEAGKQLKKSLTDPAAITKFLVTEIISALQGADKATGELAKSFGTSYNEALGIRSELNTIANLSGDINVNTKSLQESLVAINKEFGTATMFSGEILTDFTQLTKVAGISVEAAARLSKITTATGGDLSDNTEQILGQATAFNVVNGLALNEKEIVEDVSKASSAITLSMGMSVGELTKAVAQAKAFGLELAQVEQIQNSLLQFESSIEAELEAELLLGKNINLEKARQAALDNDLATLAKEIAEQAGSAADFADMNVIQQEALAKAVGMTRDGLADSLLQQEALAAAGMKEGSAAEAYNELKKQGLSDDRIAEELGSKRLAQQLKSQSNQEKFNATVEKLREIFVSLADPILKIVTPFMDLAATILPLINIALLPITAGITYIVDSTKALIDALRGNNKELTLMQSIVGSIVIAYGAIAAYNKTASLFASLRAKFEGKTLKSLIAQGFVMVKNLGIAIAKAVAQITGASAATLGIAAGIAIAAGGAAYAFLNSKKGNDIISPGYGKRTLMAPEGAIALNDKDTVIAGTDLGGGGGGNTQSINLSPLIERMSAVENVLVQILNKNVDVYLDSDKVGTSFNVNTVSVQ